MNNAEKSTSTPMVEFRNVGVQFGSFVALQDVSVVIPSAPNHGQFVTLVGPSGCGKSTLLNLLAGFQMPTQGEVLVKGSSGQGPGRDRGMIFQQYSSFPHLTVLDNVMFGLNINRKKLGADRATLRLRAEQMIGHVGLTDHMKKYPHQLSGGQQQRVAIARSLVMEPQILLMDEPFSALDEPTRLEMQELVVSLWHRIHPTIFCITHSITEAVYLGERVWIFSAAPGQIAYDIQDAIPPTVGIPPLAAQERAEFKDAVYVVTEAFRRVSEGSGPKVGG